MRHPRLLMSILAEMALALLLALPTKTTPDLRYKLSGQGPFHSRARGGT